MLKRQTLLLALVLCFGLAEVAKAAVIEVGFREQASGQYALEMWTDTPIASTGIYIQNGTPYTGLSSLVAGGTDIVGLTGVLAGINAVEDGSAPWGQFDASIFGMAPGLIVNAGPGLLPDPSLGPINTWMALGLLLPGLTAADILASEGVETYLWADPGAAFIPASDASYTITPFQQTPEPGALMLLGLGLAGLAFLRRR